MKIIKRIMLLLSLFFFCGAIYAQESDNPHSASLAAVRAGNLTKLKDLLEKRGANINSRNRPGESLLLMSIKAGNKEMINYLLEKGANIETANTSKVTPLMAAAFAGDIDTLEKLLSKGADVHALDQLKKSVC